MLLDVRYLLNLRITFPLIRSWYLNRFPDLILERPRPPLLVQDQGLVRSSKLLDSISA